MRDARILEQLIRRERGLAPLPVPERPMIGWSDRPVSGRFIIPGVTPANDPGLTEAEAWGRTDVVWEAPRRSTASRTPAKKSMRSVRGSMIDINRNQVLVFESVLEAFLAHMLVANPDIALVEDQPSPLPYRFEGEWHEHTLDYRATSRNGWREGYIVKPASQLGPDQTLAKAMAIAKQNVPKAADNIIVLSELNITRAKGMNAVEINASRKTRNQQDCNDLLDAIRGLRRGVALWELIASMPRSWTVMDAARCLIYDGSVRLHRPGNRLTDASVVSAHWQN
ncbi:hypothetical protein [Agrobacterium sp. NPDC090273]|uniref:hypothetical protein n=1 Tax=Agrobacterium sp. NPDC090273 TaxID=3363919 RepID=UPI00383B3DCB